MIFTVSKYFKHYHQLNDILNEIGLSREDFCIIGGTALNAENIRIHDDIDLCIRPKIKKALIEKYKANGKYHILENTAIKFTKSVEANKGNVFSVVNISDDELIENENYHFIYNGFKVVKLELMYSKKIHRCTRLELFRFKDLYDVYLIQKKIPSIENWDSSLLMYQNSSKERLLAQLVLTLAKFYGKLPQPINRYKIDA